MDRGGADRMKRQAALYEFSAVDPPIWAEFAETAGEFFREDPIKTIRWIAAGVPGWRRETHPIRPYLAPYYARLEAGGCPSDSPLSALRYLEDRPGTAEEFAAYVMTLPPVIRVNIADVLSQSFYYWDNMEEGAPYWLTGAEAAAFMRERGRERRRAVAMFAGLLEDRGFTAIEAGGGSSLLIGRGTT